MNTAIDQFCFQGKIPQPLRQPLNKDQEATLALFQSGLTTQEVADKLGVTYGAAADRRATIKFKGWL